MTTKYNFGKNGLWIATLAASCLIAGCTVKFDPITSLGAYRSAKPANEVRHRTDRPDRRHRHIATEPARTSAPPPHKIHVVRRGETLYSISRSYRVSVPELVYLNGLKSETITTGTHLRLPRRAG
jgi:hypothetical protein